MKIILIRTNAPALQLVPPLGIGYISAYLNKYGIDTIIIDGLRDHLNNQTILDIILKENPDAVGITCLTAVYNEVMELSNLIKQNNIKCIIGGIHPSFLPFQTLVDSKADFVVCGEGEKSFLQLAKNNFINNDIKGVYSLENLKDE
ncbi:MAG: cobalamin-dependent protein, partial [Candidatus Izemoplasmatales bacterium]|nr:cobalamin-dependent protein [Candidatus Izemoplasmatales bacterium]